MGLIEKLLNEEIKLGEDKNGENDQGAEGLLRTVRFGGYDQKETLFAVNRLQDEICALEQALNAKRLGLKYTVPPEAELSPIRHARTGGFSEKDVNAYFDRLFERIHVLREELAKDDSTDSDT